MISTVPSKPIARRCNCKTTTTTRSHPTGRSPCVCILVPHCSMPIAPQMLKPCSARTWSGTSRTVGPLTVYTRLYEHKVRPPKQTL